MCNCFWLRFLFFSIFFFFQSVLAMLDVCLMHVDCFRNVPPAGGFAPFVWLWYVCTPSHLYASCSFFLVNDPAAGDSAMFVFINNTYVRCRAGLLDFCLLYVNRFRHVPPAQGSALFCLSLVRARYIPGTCAVAFVFACVIFAWFTHYSCRSISERSPRQEIPRFSSLSITLRTYAVTTVGCLMFSSFV